MSHLLCCALVTVHPLPLRDMRNSSQIPGIDGIDTRELTKRLRERGAMLGKIVFEGDDEALVPQIDPNTLNLVAQAAISPFLATSQCL